MNIRRNAFVIQTNLKSSAHEKDSSIFKPMRTISTIAACSVSGGGDGVDAWFKTLPTGTDLQGRYQWVDVAGDSVLQYAQGRIPLLFLYL